MGKNEVQFLIMCDILILPVITPKSISMISENNWDLSEIEKKVLDYV